MIPCIFVFFGWGHGFFFFLLLLSMLFSYVHDFFVCLFLVWGLKFSYRIIKEYKYTSIFFCQFYEGKQLL